MPTYFDIDNASYSFSRRMQGSVYWKEQGTPVSPQNVWPIVFLKLGIGWCFFIDNQGINISELSD